MHIKVSLSAQLVFAGCFVWLLTSPANAGDRPTVSLKVGEVTALAFSPDGKTVVAAHRKKIKWRSYESAISFIRATDGVVRRTVALEGEKPKTVAYSPDGRTLAVGGYPVTLYDVETGKPRATFDWTADVRAMEFSPDGNMLAVGAGNVVRVWNVAAKKQRLILDLHRATIIAVKFSIDGRTIATFDSNDHVKIWNTGNGEQMGGFDGKREHVDRIAISPDARSYAATDSVLKVSFSPPRKTTIARMRDLSTGRTIASVDLGPEGYRSISAMAFSPDGNTLSCCRRGNIAMFDVATGKLLATIKGHTSDVTQLVYSPDGKTLVSSSNDGTLRVWDVKRILGPTQQRPYDLPNYVYAHDRLEDIIAPYLGGRDADYSWWRDPPKVNSFRLANVDLPESAPTDPPAGMASSIQPALFELSEEDFRALGSGIRKHSIAALTLTSGASSNFSSTHGVYDDRLRHLRDCRSLKGLRLNAARLTRGGMEHIATLKGLEVLALTGEGAKHLDVLKPLLKLRVLSIRADFTDDDLAMVRHFPNLTRLDLSTNKPLTARGLRHLAALPSLRTLRLTGRGITTDGLAEIAKLRQLQTADISHVSGGKVDWGAILDNSKLRSLTISTSASTVGGMNWIGSLRELKHLQVRYGGQESAFLAPAINLRRLETLTINSDNLSDNALVNIGKLKALKSLQLSGKITDHGLAHLKGLTNLETLTISGGPIQGGGFRHLKALEKLKSLDLSGLAITDEGLKGVAELTQLESLALRNSAAPVTREEAANAKIDHFAYDESRFKQNITDEGLKTLSTMHRLRYLTLSGCHGLTRAGLAHLGKLENLKLLELERFGDAFLTHLADLPALASVDLHLRMGLDHTRWTGISGVSTRNYQVSQNGFAELERLPNLAKLTLRGFGPFQGKWLAHVAGSLRLEMLDLGGDWFWSKYSGKYVVVPNVTDADTKYFAELDGLRRLYVYPKKLTREGLTDLTSTLVSTRIYSPVAADLDDAVTALVTDAALRRLSTRGGGVDALDLSDRRIDDRLLDILRRAKNLKRLILRRAVLSPAAIETIAKTTSLVELDLSMTSVTDDDIRKLAALSMLEQLDLTGTRVTDASASILPRFRRLRRLKLSQTGITDAAMNHIDQLTELRDLQLRGTSVKNVHLKGLPKLQRLDVRFSQVKSLRVVGATELSRLLIDGTPLDALHIEDSAQLTSLDLSFPTLRKVVLADLAGLERLELSATTLDDAGLRIAGDLGRLRLLDLAGTRVSDASLAQLRGMQMLTYLDLSGTRVTGAGLIHLAGLPRLRGLDLTNTTIDAAGLKHLEKLSSLEVLLLRGVPLAEKAITAVKLPEGLRHLDVGQTSITAAGLVHISRLPQLAGLCVDPKWLRHDTLAPISRKLPQGSIFCDERAAIARLSALGGDIDRGSAIGGIFKIENDAPKWLLELIGRKRCERFNRVVEVTPAYASSGKGFGDADLKLLAESTRLRELQLSGTKVTGAGLAHLAGLRSVEVIGGLDHATDADLAHLTRLPNLKSLDLQQAKITNAGLVHLGQLRNLESLNLRKCDITDEGVEHLGDLTKLRYLNLEKVTWITDTGLYHLMAFESLDVLNIGYSDVTDEGLRRFRGAKPDCRVDASLRRTRGPFLGVHGSPTAAECVIESVVAGGAAERAGIKAGDEIIQFSNQNITSFSDLVTLIRSKRIGERVRIIYRRGEKTTRVVVPLGPRPEK